MVATHKFMVAKAFYHNYEKFYCVGIVNRKVAMINHMVIIRRRGEKT
jgi:hypothetical protein